MQAAQIQAPGEVQIVEVARPEPGPGEVLIEVVAAGICGTDIHIYQGEYEAVYPIIPGHEFSGRVAAVGESVTRFQPGDRVTADPNVPCYRCEACQRAEFNQCENLTAVGVNGSGAFAEYVIAPEGSTFSIGGLPFSHAAMVEPLACVAWGLERVQVGVGDSVLVFGAGPMGCLIMQAVRAAGAGRVAITDVTEWRLAVAESLGVDAAVPADEEQAETLNTLAPKGFDIVADATGIPAVLERCFEYVRPRGKVWAFGVCPPDATASFAPYDVFRKDLTVIGSFAVNRTFPQSLAMLQSGAVKVEPLISHRLPLERFAEGLALAESAPDRMKVQIMPGKSA
jgi:2-desacetyl-2-hydroxyethyl bacteriochlorophyllide A dehydrogenase